MYIYIIYIHTSRKRVAASSVQKSASIMPLVLESSGFSSRLDWVQLTSQRAQKRHQYRGERLACIQFWRHQFSSRLDQVQFTSQKRAEASSVQRRASSVPLSRATSKHSPVYRFSQRCVEVQFSQWFRQRSVSRNPGHVKRIVVQCAMRSSSKHSLALVCVQRYLAQVKIQLKLSKWFSQWFSLSIG